MAAKIIVSPNESNSLKNINNLRLFLAGGITNCPDWQQVLINILNNINGLTIYNPRRKNFPINNTAAAEEQITWEYNHLKSSNIILFWFCNATLNPIVLYELGMWGNSSNIPIFIGVEPGYRRKDDVYIQTKLARPNIKIVSNLTDLGEQVSYYATKRIKKVYGNIGG